jgi:hypothetical protein
MITNQVPILASYLDQLYGIDATTNKVVKNQGTGAITK